MRTNLIKVRCNAGVGQPASRWGTFVVFADLTGGCATL